MLMVGQNKLELHIFSGIMLKFQSKSNLEHISWGTFLLRMCYGVVILGP